jgi:hypothetical protein
VDYCFFVVVVVFVVLVVVVPVVPVVAVLAGAVLVLVIVVLAVSVVLDVPVAVPDVSVLEAVPDVSLVVIVDDVSLAAVSLTFTGSSFLHPKANKARAITMRMASVFFIFFPFCFWRWLTA